MQKGSEAPGSRRVAAQQHGARGEPAPELCTADGCSNSTPAGKAAEMEGWQRLPGDGQEGDNYEEPHTLLTQGYLQNHHHTASVSGWALLLVKHAVVFLTGLVSSPGLAHARQGSAA